MPLIYWWFIIICGWISWIISNHNQDIPLKLGTRKIAYPITFFPSYFVSKNESKISPPPLSTLELSPPTWKWAEWPDNIKNSITICPHTCITCVLTIAVDSRINISMKIQFFLCQWNLEGNSQNITFFKSWNE